MRSKYVWMNGQVVPYADATVHLLTPALHYGIAAFEGIRCYATERGPAVFRLRDHMERLVGSAKILGWEELPYSADALIAGCKQTIAANALSECYIRPIIYLAEGGWNLNICGTKPGIGIAVWEWKAYLGEEALARGVRANVSSFARHHPNATMTKAKISGNYVNSFLAKSESSRLGFDEAIMLDPSGFVAECTGENLFIVRKGRIYTSPGAPILEGITRSTLATLAADLGFAVEERPISRDQLYVADEVFVCGTAAEVIGLREIDNRVIGCGATGPVTRALQQAYAKAVAGEHPRSAGWLDYVGLELLADERVKSA